VRLSCVPAQLIQASGNDAETRVSRYLLIQLVVNLTYAVPIGLALYFIGVPIAILWGLLAAVGRFVRYLGPQQSAGSGPNV
jgi:predicted PurR-regulated permease PerM